MKIQTKREADDSFEDYRHSDWSNIYLMSLLLSLPQDKERWSEREHHQLLLKRNDAAADTAPLVTLTIECSLSLVGSFKHFVTVYFCFWNMNELLGLFVRVVETQTYISA